MMIQNNSALASALKGLVDEWRKEIKIRRRRSQHDPVAEALDACAAEVQETVKVYDAADATLTVDQYAKDHGVTPQTVRNWIRRKELEARKTPNGWAIPRGAERRLPSTVLSS